MAEEKRERTLPVIVNEKTGCWEFQGTRNPKGYGLVKVKGEKWLAHRLSYMHYKGPIPKGMLVCHSCDNPPCVNPNHLFLGSNRLNMIDMAMKGRGGKKKGATHIQSKFIDPVEFQKALDELGQDYDALAERFGCSYGYVIRYLRGETWQKFTPSKPMIVGRRKKPIGPPTKDASVEKSENQS